MTATRQLVEKYLEAWNEADPLRRHALIKEVCVEHAAYIDPMIEARGWEAIDATVAGMQNMFPGHVFRLAGEVDVYHAIAGTVPAGLHGAGRATSCQRALPEDGCESTTKVP